MSDTDYDSQDLTELERLLVNAHEIQLARLEKRPASLLPVPPPPPTEEELANRETCERIARTILRHELDASKFFNLKAR